MRRPALFAAVALATTTAQAQIAAGDYVAKGGAFTLQVTPGAFEIAGVVANGNTCTIDGLRQGLTGRASTPAASAS